MELLNNLKYDSKIASGQTLDIVQGVVPDCVDREIKDSKDKEVVDTLIENLGDTFENFATSNKESDDVREFSLLLQGLTDKYSSLFSHSHDSSMDEIETITADILLQISEEFDEVRQKEDKSEHEQAKEYQLFLDFCEVLMRCREENREEFDKFIDLHLKKTCRAPLSDLLMRKKRFNTDSFTERDNWYFLTREEIIESILATYLKNPDEKIEKRNDCEEGWFAHGFRNEILKALKDFKNDPCNSEYETYFIKLASLMSLILEREPKFFGQLIEDSGLLERAMRGDKNENMHMIDVSLLPQ